MSELKVKIGTDLSNLQKGIAQAAGIVANSSNQMSNATNSVQKSFTVLNNTKFTFGANFQTASQKLANEAIKTGAALGGSMKKGAEQAAFALTNTGRVLQDLPFGFLGIQNNLNPLLESFQRLKVETGSTIGALKALGSSLIGPAGIGFALSLVSAGILMYQQYQQKANKETKIAKATTEEYISTLNQVEASRLKGAQSAQDELVNVRLLFKAYQNANLPLNTRKEAYSQLQQQYPDYFKNIKFEQEASEKTTTAYNNLTSAILATARARAAQDLITKNSSRQLEDEQKITDLRVLQLKAREAEAKAKDRLDLNSGVQDIASGRQDKFVRALLSAQSKREAIDTQINNLVTDRNILTERNLQLEKSVNVELEKGAKLTGNVGNTPSNTRTAKRPNLNEPLQRLGPITKVAEEFAKAGAVISDNGDLIAKGIQNAQDKINQIDLQAASKKFNEFNDNIESVLNGGVVDALSGIAEAFGEALASGNGALEASGAALLGTVGGILVQLGNLAISTGIGIKAIKTALETLNPVVAIAAGVALVALGSLVKGAAANIGNGGGSDSSGPAPRRIPGFAKGVTNFSGGLALVGEEGPELVNLPTGSDVIPNNRIGQFNQGSQNITLSGGIEISMGKLLVALKQEEKLRGRTS